MKNTSLIALLLLGALKTSSLLGYPAYVGTWKLERVGITKGSSFYGHNDTKRGTPFDLSTYPDLIPNDVAEIKITASTPGNFTFTGAGSSEERLCAYDDGVSTCSVLESEVKDLEYGCQQETSTWETLVLKSDIPISYFRETWFKVSESYISDCEDIPSLIDLSEKIKIDDAGSFWKALKNTNSLDLPNVPRIKSAILSDEYRVTRN